MNRNFQYIRLANELEKKIRTGDFPIGEKLPSIRGLHRRTGVSITTAYQAMIELEKRNLVEVRPKSGFFVNGKALNQLKLPDTGKQSGGAVHASVNELAAAIVEDMTKETVVQFGGAAPSYKLLPGKMIHRAIRRLVAADARETLTYEPPQGDIGLRREIAKRMMGTTGNISAEEIIITNGCLEAVALCLRSVTRPMDTVAVESPVFHGFLQLMEDFRLKVLEIPASPSYGVDLEFLGHALETHDIKAFISVPTINNPQGYVMEEQDKQDLVAVLSERGIPIIEDGIYSDLQFNSVAGRTLKSYDKKGMVLYCSSFSKTLAPGLRIGWTAPGRYYPVVKRLKVNTSIMCPGLNQRVIADILKTGFYDRHIRRLTNTLKIQMNKTAMAVGEYFPDDTAITDPAGGLLLWVQLNPSIDCMAVYREAIKESISILPGTLCSTSDRYKNCIRLSCGFPFNEEAERGIRKLGRIIKSLKG